MTYKRHWLLSWGGSLAGFKDIWANNIRFMNKEALSPDGIPGSTLERMLDDFVKDIRAFHTHADAFINANAVVEWVKFNEIGPDGRYTDASTTHARYLSGNVGDLAVMKGAATTGVPAYQSVCITTTTGVQRGPGSKGRLFLPQCAPTLLLDGFIEPTAAQRIANKAGTFFTSLGNEAGIDVTGLVPAVVSNVGEPGPQNKITGVKVGSVPDVISRRKNALVEVYSSATVST